MTYDQSEMQAAQPTQSVRLVAARLDIDMDIGNLDLTESETKIGMDHAKPALAVDHFRKAAAKAPDDAPWRADLEFQLAQAEILAGSKPAALAAFKKFLLIAPADAPTRHEAESQVARLGGAKKKQLGAAIPRRSSLHSAVDTSCGLGRSAGIRQRPW